MSQVLWITGLAGAGKTTLARTLLEGWPGQRPIHLDGDRWRETLGPLGLGYAPDQRLAIGTALARLSLELAAQQQRVIVSTISRFSQVGDILARTDIPVLRVHLQANWECLRSRRPGIHGGEVSPDHALPWPFPCELVLPSDSADALAANVGQILVRWR